MQSACLMLIISFQYTFVMDHTAAFYSRPSSHVGGGFNVFAGSRRQRGGGIFGTLKNFFLPVAKNIGKSLFSHGVGLAKDVARDAMEGKSIKDSLMNRGKSRALDFGKSAVREGVGTLSNMVGKGGRRAPRKRKAKIRKTIRRRKPVRKRKNKPRQRRRPISSKTVSRKRRKPVKTSRHNAKRRRTVTNF